MKTEQGASLRDSLNIIYRRISLLKLTIVLLPVGVLVACLMITPVYQSTAKIIVTAKKETSALLQFPREMGPSANVNLNVDERDLNSEMDLLKSTDLWIRTVKKIGVAKLKPEEEGMLAGWLKQLDATVERVLGRPAAASPGDLSREEGEIYSIAMSLLKQFKVTTAAKSKILDLTFKYPDRVMVHKILSTLLDEYLPYHLEVYSLPGVEKFFSGQGDMNREKYETADAKLAAFKKQWGIALPERQKQELIVQVNKLQDSLTEVTANLSQYEQMMASLEKGIIPSGQLAPSAQRGTENTYISVLGAQLLRANQKQLQTKEIYLADSRDYRAATEMVDDLMKKFRSALEVEMEVARAKKVSLEASLGDAERQLEQLEEKSELARRLQLDVTIAKERYLQYVAREEDARIENLKVGGKLLDVKVIGVPVTSPNPVFPSTFLFVLGALLLSLPLGVGLILFANFFDNTFTSSVDLENSTGHPVLASFGKLLKAPASRFKRGT
jgi:uncharacterized protein involved in exopolysaccharide biosynthesis